MTILTIVAILLAPLIAIQVSIFLSKSGEIRNRKLWLFRTLMATRGNRISPEHVRALNMIELDFMRNNQKEKEVREAWKLYDGWPCLAGFHWFHS